MSHSFPRPSEPFLYVERTPVDGTCPECGAEALAEYPVLSEGGWWNVRKCQACLASVVREPGPLFGAYVPLGLQVTRAAMSTQVTPPTPDNARDDQSQTTQEGRR